MLILARHGRTDHNASGRLLGRLDPELDEVGLVQADALGAVLAQPGRLADGVRIVSSPLRRAQATARAIAVALAVRVGREVEVTVDERWIELDYGDYDGMPLADVPAELWQRWRTDTSFRPPNGESIDALGVRVRSSIADLEPDARAGDVIVVSHVSPIKAGVAWALGVGDEVAWRLFLAPASISRIACPPAGPSLHTFNDTGHLP